MPGIDYAALRESIPLLEVLRGYGFVLRPSGKEFRGACKLPSHTSKEANSFTADATKNAWTCWSTSCRKGREVSGNVLGLVMAMEGCTLYEAANRLIERYGVETKKPAPNDGGSNRTGLSLAKQGQRVADYGETSSPHNNIRNPPLAFALKSIDYSHPYITSRGITRETAEHFGVGYFGGKGSMAGRIVFPIVNADGLVAYAGRVLDDSEPRYKFPPGFRKGLEMWNLYRCTTEAPLLITEGFWGTMWMFQNGQKNVCALMGSHLTPQQEQLIEPYRAITLALDYDDAGKSATKEIAGRLEARHKITKMYLKD